MLRAGEGVDDSRKAGKGLQSGEATSSKVFWWPVEMRRNIAFF
jgi:hypothetical protein